MIQRTRYLVVSLLLVVISIAKVALWAQSKSRPEVRVYDYSFSDVVDYLNHAFRTNVTACITTYPAVWGPNFLSTDTVYWVETKEYQPGTNLVFKAWFAQIGAEHNTFFVQQQDPMKTRIAVNQEIKFFIPIPFTRDAESRILKALEEDMGRVLPTLRLQLLSPQNGKVDQSGSD